MTCLETDGKLCWHCSENAWIGPQVKRVPQPFPDFRSPGRFHPLGKCHKNIQFQQIIRSKEKKRHMSKTYMDYDWKSLADSSELKKLYVQELDKLLDEHTSSKIGKNPYLYKAHLIFLYCISIQYEIHRGPLNLYVGGHQKLSDAFRGAVKNL